MPSRNSRSAGLPAPAGDTAGEEVWLMEWPQFLTTSAAFKGCLFYFTGTPGVFELEATRRTGCQKQRQA
ncbi:hypothetical protein TAMC210_22310 [Thermanaeromonas sp. C210]|nr:hypothetical protein TAMC210_22310 [Thermanaeromonas sp. C210]